MSPTVPERVLSRLPRPVLCWVYRKRPDSRLWRDATWLNFYGKEYRMALKQKREAIAGVRELERERHA